MPKAQKHKGFGIDSSHNSSKKENHYQDNHLIGDYHCHCPHCQKNFYLTVVGVGVAISEKRGRKVKGNELEAIAGELNKAVAISQSLGLNAAMFGVLGFAVLVKQSWFTAPNLNSIGDGVKVEALGGVA